jgi:hypothetical protein
MVSEAAGSPWWHKARVEHRTSRPDVASPRKRGPLRAPYTRVNQASQGQLRQINLPPAVLPGRYADLRNPVPKLTVRVRLGVIVRVKSGVSPMAGGRLAPPDWTHEAGTTR